MSRLHATILVICSLFLTAVLYVASSAVALAQVAASITGRVEDPSGAPIPGANVTTKSLETGAERTVASDETGNFRVLALPEGRYEVKAEKAGFKAAVQTGINLVVGQQAVVNLGLEVGTLQEQVTVTSDAPLVNTTTASISGLVGEQQVKDLPINGRSFDLLITLNPGTINYTSNKGGGSGLAGTGGNLFSVAGRRSSENLTLLNGVQYTGAGNAAVTPGGASGQLLGVDAVREYNVVSDSYGAEYGQRSGGQISVVTQSGTNQVHGTLFEFLRNSVLNTRNFFDPNTIAPFKRNQFGGALGGPIRKDRTFIFGNYEGFRQRLGLSLVDFVPDAAMRRGLLPCGGAAGCPAGTAPTLVPNLDTRMLPFVNDMWPAPNGPELGTGVAESFNSPNQPIHQDFGTVRVDQRFSDKDSLSGTYTIDDSGAVLPGGGPAGGVPLFGNSLSIRNQVASLQETHIFSPTVVNTFTAGFSRSNYFNPAVALVPLPSSLDFVQGHLPGAITIGNVNTSTGLDMPGSQNPFVSFKRNLFTYTDGVQIIRGKHQISAGVWFQRLQDNDNYPLRGNGSAAFSSYATLLQGTVSTFTVAPKTTANGWRSWEGAWYVQDSIQLRPNLTVRVGLRDEFSNGWSEVHGQAQAYLFQQGVIQTLPRTGDQFNTANNSKLLLSPRVGIAWDPFGKGKTSIRAAGGIYYNQLDWLLYFVDQTPPLNGALNLSNLSFFSIIPVNPAAPLLPPCGPGGVTNVTCNLYAPKSIASDYKIPTVDEWNFSVEQQLIRATALRVAYVGSHNYHNWLTIDPNTVQQQICNNAAGCLAGGINAARSTVAQGTAYIPVAATRPNPYLSSGFFSETAGNGNYNSLVVEVLQRLTKGLQFRANYTWAKNMDFASAIFSQIGGTGGGSANAHPQDLSQDYGQSSLTVKNQATGNLSYLLPFGQGKPFLGNVHGVADKLISGWQFNTIVTLLSGYPMTVTAGPNQSGDGNLQGSDRPSLAVGATNNPIYGTSAGCGGIPAGQNLQTPTRWFDPCAFVLSAPGTFGNLGRNTIIGPGLATVDFSLFKNTKISERIGLQFRAEFFNSLNHANFSIPASGIFAGGTYATNAGVISGTATPSRQIQFGLKLSF